MNKKILIILLSLPMLSLVQVEKKDQKLTPEQRNIIKSKELALKLDLNES